MTVILAAILLATCTTLHADPPTVVFEDKTDAVGLTLSNGAACWADFDADGWVDISTGVGVFRNVSGKTFEKIGHAGAAVAADYDNDGDLDLVSAGRLFENQGGKQYHWLKVKLQGDGPVVNRAAIGAQVRVTAGDRILTRQVEAGTGEGNQNELTLHFGLGQHADAVRVEVLWPNGSKQEIREANPNSLLEIQFQAKR